MADIVLQPREEYVYGTEHVRQTLSVWPLAHNAPTTASQAKLWIIYIHGGAWRDPAIDHTSFQPTLTSLTNHLQSASSLHHIHAFVSLDYRLSPHPSYPQDPTTTPANQYRNARHPDHIHDIKSGLHFLQQRFDFGNNYILVGHSCGATLAFQAVLGPEMLLPRPDIEVVAPRAIAGVCGIYDVPLLLRNHVHPAYREFVTGAFGDRECWTRVSPAVCMAKDSGYLEGVTVLLAYSVEDELIDEAQVRSLGERKTVVLRGGHDEVWKEGGEMARVVRAIIGMIV